MYVWYVMRCMYVCMMNECMSSNELKSSCEVMSQTNQRNIETKVDLGQKFFVQATM